MSFPFHPPSSSSSLLLTLCYYHYLIFHSSKLQSFPVAASSLCLLMLSLDRYVTVKHPRLAQLRQRKFLPSILASVSWIGSALLCTPFLIVYKVFSSTKGKTPASSSTVTGHQLNSPTSAFPIYRDSNLISDKRLCVSDYGSSESWHIVFIVSYVSFVFIVPIIGVIFNHIGKNTHRFCIDLLLSILFFIL